MIKWYILSAMIGVAAGYTYYFFIGCYSGTCSLLSSPYWSMVLGGLFGMTLLPDAFTAIQKKLNPESANQDATEE